jgi:hypothetical protein
MSTFAIVVNTAEPALSRLAGSIQGSGNMARFLMQWGARVRRQSILNARAKGGRRFWKDIARAINLEPSAGVITVVCRHVAAAQKQFGGVIEAKGKAAGGADYLTIPIADEAEGQTAAKFTAEDAWQLTIHPGTILDRIPTILYQRKDDPRGWTVPEGYVEDPASTSPWIERDLLDDPIDPPILVLRDPPAGDFTRIADTDRLALESGAFCSEADWQRELWRAHVILSARPYRQAWQSIALPPPTLNRFRITAARALPPATDAASGATFELATLYLLRDPSAPEAAELKVRQREWWSLWTAIVQPLADLPGEISNLGDGQGGLNDLIAQLSGARIEETLAGTATVEAWTV